MPFIEAIATQVNTTHKAPLNLNITLFAFFLCRREEMVVLVFAELTLCCFMNSWEIRVKLPIITNLEVGVAH
jgi:hypothetical protein